MEVEDPVIYNKYIKWNPPAAIISAIVPSGYNLRIDYSDKDHTLISDGITKAIQIIRPIVSMYIVKK